MSGGHCFCWLLFRTRVTRHFTKISSSALSATSRRFEDSGAAKYVRPYSKGRKNDFRDAEAVRGRRRSSLGVLLCGLARLPFQNRVAPHEKSDDSPPTDGA